MKIEKFTNRDKDKLAKCLLTYWKSRGMQFSLSWTLNYLKKGMTTEMTSERFVAKDSSGRIVGTIALLKYEKYIAEIRDEIWENDDVGTQLIESLIAYAAKHAIRKLYSLSLKDKVRLYRKRGFVKEGMLKSQFRPGEHVTVMSKFL